MRYVLTPEEMTAAEKSSGIDVALLMSRAGEAVAREVVHLAGGAYGRRIVVVCGKGNNGGDGEVAAAHLRTWGGLPVVIRVTEGVGLLTRQIARADVIVDAMVGTGFKGSLEGDFALASVAMNASSVPVVSVDVPSGVDGLTGAVKSLAVRAQVTVTLAALKRGLLIHPGASYAGRLIVADIGIDDRFFATDVALIEKVDVADVVYKRPPTAHKRSVGKVLVVAGSPGMSGAAVLCGSAAFRVGAGLVRLAVPRSIAEVVDRSLVEATVIALSDTHSGSIDPSAVAQVLEAAASVDAVVVGPGLGPEQTTWEFVRKLISVIEIPVVLDADGLNAFNGQPELLQQTSAPILLTPHAGELARLIDVVHDPIESAKAAAERTGAVVLLKGQPTVIASPNGQVRLCIEGGPFLATAGTGDVLAGIACGLTTKRDVFTAAPAAAWIHGRAGAIAAGMRSQTGVIARDVVDAIPAAIEGLQ